MKRMQAALARNLKLYPWFLAFTYESFSNAVWYLYLYSFKGIGLLELAWLTLLGDGVIAAAEVPTGWLADRIGRRRSMLLGIGLQISSFLLFIYGNSFAAFWLAMAICGLGDTFRNGADRALLYDSALALDQSARYRQLVGHGTFVATIVFVFAGLIGGWLATRVSWYLPFWCDIGSSLVGLVLTLLMREAPQPADVAETAADSEPAASDAAQPPQLAVRRSRGLLALAPLLLLAMVFGIAPELSHFHLPAELEGGIAVTPLTLAWLYGGFELLQALGAKLGGSPRWHGTRTLVAGTLLMALLLGLAALRQLGGLPTLLLYLLARAAIDLLYGLAEPLFSEEINRRVPSRVRATALSWLNAVGHILPLGLLPLSAKLVEARSFAAMYVGFGAGALLLGLLCGMWVLRSDAPGKSGRLRV